MVKDVSDGEFSENKSVQDYQNFLAGLVANPKKGEKSTTADGKAWINARLNNQFETSGKLNPATGWPEGSTFAWIGDDGATSLTLKTAGEKKTGDVKITLPSGSTFTVKDITVVSQANVHAQSETVDYGTIKSAADLVTNKDAFPAGTTFQFVGNTEPNWKKSGSYKNVQITASYNGYKWDEQTNAWVAGPITTDPADCAVAINDTLNITILQGATVPTLSAILNFALNWEAHTASWTKDINTNSTDHGEITVHYPKSNLDQVIKVFVTVIPKDSPINGIEFTTNGSKFDGTTGSIAPGTTNQGAILTKDNGAAVNYDTYNKSGVQGEPSTFKQEPTSYTPTYNLTGLETNKEGNLVSGPQTVTVHVSVPNGTIGASVDSDGNSDYELTSNIIVAQPVTFDLVDDDANGKVVSSQSNQEFIKGQSTKLNTPLTIPTNYQLADGKSQNSLTTYTLPDYSKTPVVVKIHLVHRTDTVDPNTPTTNPTSDPNWFKINNLVKDVTRTINYVDANGNKVADPTTQTVEFTRTATYDKVTGQVVKDSEGSWTTKSGSFAAVTPPTIAKMGLKSIADANGQSFMTKDGQVPAVDQVKATDGNSIVTVTYVSGQNVTFEFVDTYNNDAVIGKSYDQFLIYGKDTKLDFTMTMPEGQAGVYSYVLADGQSIPTSYTFTESSPTVVKVGVHQSMHFNIAFHDDDENRTLYTATVPTKDAWNRGYCHIKFPDGTFPQGINPINYCSVSVDAPEGTTFTGSYQKPLTDPSAVWWIPNYSWDKSETVEKALTGATITIHLKHKTETLNRNSYMSTVPKTEDGTPVTRADFSKTFTRTITEYLPAAAGQESKKYLSQTVTLTRTGVRDLVTNILTWNDFTTGKFAAVTVAPQAGYTTSITQQIGQAAATPISSIGEMDVNGNTTQPINIVIRYGATATAKLSGNGKSTYNGSPITVGDLNKNLKVTVTGPTATSGTYSLKSGDVEFSTDGQTWTTDLPTNASTYQVRLTAQGEHDIQDQFGNNSIVWAQDGKSTITSNASWTINKLTTDSVMNNAQAGNYSQTYNGIVPSSIDPSKFTFTTQVNGKTITLTANELTSDDFTWVDGSAPVNVGTYQVKLTDTGFAKLQADNPNFTLTNTGEGTFTITQADATGQLSGSGTRAYNGFAVTTADLNVHNYGNNITLTLHYPKDGNANYSTTVKLSDGDYSWNTPDGKAPVNANDQAYTLTLNPDAVQKLIEKAVGSGQNGQSNVKFSDNAIGGSASFLITPLASKATLANTEAGNYSKVYDAQATDQIDASKFQLTADVNGKTVVLNTAGIDGNSYQWVNATGNALKDNPKNVGTYYIKLTSDAFKTLQADILTLL